METRGLFIFYSIEKGWFRMNYTKYKPLTNFIYPGRTWPNKTITKAPIWCSVDLRDGNQALEIPMSLEQKVEYFEYLVKLGFKEIEVGFPAASETEYAFTRKLIEENLIPDDVTIQVLTQSREEIIARTFESLAGVKKAIVHLYASTSPLHREVVFQTSREEVKNIAVTGARQFVALAEKYGPERFRFEFSPETFTSTEMDYAAEVCNAVLDVWQPSPERKVIINLPSTVELTAPNIYADQIEYMCGNLCCRENVIVSLHPHNDRGCGVAATELALLAGADRVEGTLFGNGERTGNVDIVNVALNLYTHGVDPGLELSNMGEITATYKRLTAMPVHPRHPYAGELVFVAFSGSHQDAIKKGSEKLGSSYDTWSMPYLTIDPADIGRSYEAIIRINSQSGKGGVAYVLEHNYGMMIPKAMQQEFGRFVTGVSDSGHRELMPQDIYNLFQEQYINLEAPVSLVKYSEATNGSTVVSARITVGGEERMIEGSGNGILDAFCKAITQELGVRFDIKNYSEHSMEYGSKSRAITYLHILVESGRSYFGAGVSSSISKSSIKAVISAVNRMIR